MSTTCIPNPLADLIGVAAEMSGAILIYQNDVIVFANEAGRKLYACQDWSRPVSFDGCFRRAVELGRMDDPTILADPEGHLAYAKMVRARERRHSFQRNYDGILYDRHHVALDAEWNAQIWVEARPHTGLNRSAFDLAGQVEQRRSLLTLTDLLERMGIAMAIVTAQGQLVESSALMKRHFRTGEALERGLGNRIACANPDKTVRLREAIAAVAAGHEDAALIPASTGADAQRLIAVMPTPVEGMAAVVVQEVARPEPLRELLVAGFGLTQRQAEVAVRVAGGETAEQIATALDRKIDTVRQQIVTSKAKIAAGRQQDLACIITRAAALFGGASSPATRREKQ